MKPPLTLFSLLAAAMVLVGCDQHGKERGNVAAKYPNSLIYFVGNDPGNCYIVKKSDGSVWEVNCNNVGSFDVSSSSMIFPPDDPSPR